MGLHKNSSRERWIKLAKKTIIDKGVEAINVDVMSKKLGVSKTSFYHFFSSKAEFLDLVFEKGIFEGTQSLIVKLSPISDPKMRIKALIKVIFNENLKNELFLRQLRTYGMHNKKIARFIDTTEKQRMSFLKGILLELDFDEESAETRSSIFYIYTLGLYERIYINPDILQNKEQIYSNLWKILFAHEK
jgi:AcrR family transcriptional regulator